MSRQDRKALKAEQKAAKLAKKQAAKERAANSPTRRLIKQHAPTIFGIRIPGFFKIHMRYAKRSFTTWFVLFIAPFVISVILMGQIARTFFDLNPSDIQLFIIAFFLIAVAFFCAERNRDFRKAYVLAIPALVLVYGVIGLFTDTDPFPGNLFKFAVLSALPALWLWQRARDKGYKMLSDGADKDYRPGRDLYMDGQYAQAFTHLEPAAKRGHMKSLYLLGHAHEHGQGRDQDRVRAARFYDKASRKGYAKARRAFDDLFESFDATEIKAFETELGVIGSEELF
ncbi:MAG: sel1 repeat family protein [Acidimicrobiales bacterium]|nr:sel1 repeat family protein [Hyphomonadaceae bacterium]RZV43285.1 MAG: sel1 repeat family protein [Acidimicrobiales bacterium]